MHAATVSRPASGKVYLAVKDDTKQCMAALKWASHSIPPQTSLVLVHINRPATRVPDVVLGATMQARMLREDVVSGYGKDVRNMIKENLVKCLQSCKVQAEILISDHSDVTVALLELIKRKKIITLVMCVRNRGNDWKSKTSVVLEEQADRACNILYVCDGILISSRHQRTNACTAGKNEIFSLGVYHFSGSSSTIASKSSSFFNSHSTAKTFDSERLGDRSMEINATHIFNDNRFKVIIDIESFAAFEELVNQQFLDEHLKDLNQAFDRKYCDIFTKCRLIGGFDSFLGVDCQNIGDAHWKSIKSWPAVLEYIVRVLDKLQVQLLKQNHHPCNGFTRVDLLEAAEELFRRLFTVASIVSDLEVRKSPEKLFCVLNMYTELTDAIPAIMKFFDRESTSTDVKGILAKLKDSARGIVKELKYLVRAYSPQKLVEDGSIMSITRYLMRYIRLLVKHKSSLDIILGNEQTDGFVTVEEMGLTRGLVLGLIADLESVLVKQSKSFASKGLQCIFLMNHTHFILQKVEQSDVRLIVGSKWIRKRQQCVKEYMQGYISVSWGPAAKDTPIRKRRKTNPFNFWHASLTPLESLSCSFNEICNSQTCWKVPSPDLRDARAYHAHLEVLKQPGDFEPELKSKISELFEG